MDHLLESRRRVVRHDCGGTCEEHANVGHPVNVPGLRLAGWLCYLVPPFAYGDEPMSGSMLDDLEARHLVAQSSDRDALVAHLQSGSRTLYSGFDPTADSLHIGHLVPLLALRRFQLAGHRPLALVGGATGLIGDPSFKDNERSLNDPEQVASWVEAIRRQVSGLLDTEGPQGALVVNNLDWIQSMDTISFLRDVGKHFSVNAMIQKESVKARIEREGAGISFTEFSYIILQSIDFTELARRYDCSLQIGGSDQWGNITGGMDLVRRMLGRTVHGLTMPLVTKADGSKFGKTESGTVWLDPRKTSPYSFYQFWLNAADADVVKYLGYFSFRSPGDIQALAAAHGDAPHLREAQRVLARDMTVLIHGNDGLAAAERITDALFSGSIDQLEAADLAQLRLDGMAACAIDPAEPGLLAAMVEGGLAPSRGAARKLVEGGGVRVNGNEVGDAGHLLSPGDALHGRYHLIRRGKKAWLLAFHP